MNTEYIQPITREIDVYLAVSRGRKMARARGFDDIDRTKIEIAILELARNILVHAGTGSIEMRHIKHDGRHGIEIVAADHGSGIADVELALRDGYSTAASLGSGLPGVKRLMDEFNLETQLGIGTVITVRRWIPIQPKRKR